MQSVEWASWVVSSICLQRAGRGRSTGITCSCRRLSTSQVAKQAGCSDQVLDQSKGHVSSMIILPGSHHLDSTRLAELAAVQLHAAGHIMLCISGTSWCCSCRSICSPADRSSTVSMQMASLLSGLSRV